MYFGTQEFINQFNYLKEISIISMIFQMYLIARLHKRFLSYRKYWQPPWENSERTKSSRLSSINVLKTVRALVQYVRRVQSSESIRARIEILLDLVGQSSRFLSSTRPVTGQTS